MNEAGFPQTHSNYKLEYFITIQNIMLTRLHSGTLTDKISATPYLNTS